MIELIVLSIAILIFPLNILIKKRRDAQSDSSKMYEKFSMTIYILTVIGFIVSLNRTLLAITGNVYEGLVTLVSIGMLILIMKTRR